MKDWDKRVEEALDAYMSTMDWNCCGTSDILIAQEDAFDAGANFARELIAKDNFQELMNPGTRLMFIACGTLVEIYYASSTALTFVPNAVGSTCTFTVSANCVVSQ